MRVDPPVNGPDDAPEAPRVLAVLWRIISTAPFPVQIEMQSGARCPTGKKFGWHEPLCIPEPLCIVEAQFAAPAANVNDPDVNDAATRSTKTMPAATAIRSRRIAVSLDLPFAMKRGAKPRGRFAAQVEQLTSGQHRECLVIHVWQRLHVRVIQSGQEVV